MIAVIKQQRQQKSARKFLNFLALQTVKEPMLLSKYNRAAGELEGARPASSWIIAIKNVRKDFLTSKARFFVKRKLHKKCGVFEACKKAIGFFDTLKCPEVFKLPGTRIF